MAPITTTHRHDFRWPTADCLVPRAEAPSSKCVAPPPTDESGRIKSWCGRDKPLGPAPSSVQLPYPAQGDSAKPWCQRGLLVEMISPRPATTPPQVRSVPIGCEASALGRPWCEGDAPPRPLAVRVGAAPQQDTSRYDQPNQYLRKLCDKFPEPVSVVTAKPRDELMRRVYADRYRTTYQAGYCRNLDDIARTILECDSHDPNNKYQAVRVSRTDNGDSHTTQEPQYKTCRGCGCVCKMAARAEDQSTVKPRTNSLACKPVNKNVHFSCCNVKRKDGQHGKDHVGPPEKIPPWVSEYNDSIGKTAQMIIEHKLLYPKKEKKHIL